ncbi:MAG TPA: serine hydrolase domain-containing protein [Gaiellaceae bacterium]|nr:serine hydrolase domain-containing protein [Gaiellaceae bacterium]
MDALRSIESWPSEHAAAGVARADGVVDVVGDTEHDFPFASVTKLLVAYATLVAAEEGSVELDDPAGPEGSTLRHLLAHASGLGPDGDVLSAPERTRIYSNAGINLLAQEVEERTGIAFADYLAEAVLRPLELGAELRGAPAEGMVGTVHDLLAFGRELLEPRLISRETLDEATSVQFSGLKGVLPGFGRMDPNDWGLGFELRDGKSPHWTGSRNDPGTFGHFGSKRGSATFLWADRAAGLACAGLADVDFGPWAKEAWPALADAVLSAGSRAGAG